MCQGRRDAHRGAISALTSPLNHSSTGSELAFVNSPFLPLHHLAICKRYEISKRARARALLTPLRSVRYGFSKENR